VCCSVSQCVAVIGQPVEKIVHTVDYDEVCVAVCCSMVCCSVLQCVAECGSL